MIHSLILASVALCSGGSTGTAAVPAIDDSWTTLDREIAALAQAQAEAKAEAPAGPKISGYLRVSTYWSDIPLPGSTEDQLGTAIANTRINVGGKVGEVTYRISKDGASQPPVYPPAAPTVGTVAIRDAWASMPLAEGLNLQMGRNKTPFLFSEMVGEEKQLFWDRPLQGDTWKGRDQGVQLNGRWGHIRAWAQLMNGGDASGDEQYFNALAAYDLIAGKGMGGQEGGFGPDAETNLTLAAGYVDDGSFTDGDAINGQLLACSGPFYFQGEVVSYGDGYVPGAAPTGPATGPSNLDLAGTTGWDAALSYALNEKWEIAARYQDTDDPNNTDIVTGGLNWYYDGWSVKWYLNWDHVSSDLATAEGDRALIGLLVAF